MRAGGCSHVTCPMTTSSHNRMHELLSNMGAKHCCVLGCGANKRKNRGLSFHKIPAKGISADKDEWRRQLLVVISPADMDFNPDTAHICSRHFEEACFEQYGTPKKLKLFSLPTRHMPQNCVDAVNAILAEEPPAIPDVVAYSNYQDLQHDVMKVLSDMPRWSVRCKCDESNGVTFSLIDGKDVKLYLSVTDTLVNYVTIREQRHAYPENAVQKQGLNKVLTGLQEIKLCQGVTCENLQRYAEDRTQDIANRANFYKLRSSGSSTIYSEHCLLETTHTELCKQCSKVKVVLMEKFDRDTSDKPISKYANLSKLQPRALISLLKTSRDENKCLRKQLKHKLKEESFEIEHSMHRSLTDVMDSSSIENDFVRVFWEQQKQAFGRSPGGMRWHPMLLRFAIMIHSYSPAAYCILRDTGVLKLPGESTLRDYTNVITPTSGFQMDALKDLKEQASQLEEKHRCIVVCHDEMQIKDDLVFDRRGEKIVGFIDKEKWTFNEMDNTENVATHALVFFAVGVSTNIKSAIAYFPTKDTTALDIHPKFWRAVDYLETDCKLKVVASISDKAESNLSFYDMHQHAGEDGMCYKVTNQVAPDRSIYFMSDPQHLLKAFRNNLEKSRSDGPHLWCEGHVLLWDHVVDVWKRDHGQELYQTKLTKDHIYLTSKTRTSVSLASEVMSASTSIILDKYFPSTHQYTSKFIALVDRFCDCLNASHLFEAHNERKPDLAAYTSCNDPRFDFLQDEFLGFLRQWKQSVDQRTGPFTAAQKKKMFLSEQTYVGVQMTVMSFIELTRFLLSNNVSFVLSNIFCQDPLEEYFGRHPMMARRSENPTLYTCGSQDRRIQLQRSLVKQFRPRGNNKRGKTSEDTIIVSNSPLTKCKRQRRHK